jgi:hypothetical protein
MTEYTLVFRRAVRFAGRTRGGSGAWIVVRPAAGGASVQEGEAGENGEVAQVFVVPICSALGLDGVAYEHFLHDSGVLGAALAVLGGTSLTRPGDVVTARKEVQALVMAAEVQHIIDRMSA